jgi:hypothetical protein
MEKIKVVYQSKEEIYGYFPKGNDSLTYAGVLTVSDKAGKNMVTLDLTIKRHLYIMELPDKKIFNGESVTQVYGKLSKWFYSYGIVFMF